MICALSQCCDSARRSISCLTFCLMCLAVPQLSWSENVAADNAGEITPVETQALPKLTGGSSEAQQILDQIDKLTRELSQLRNRVQPSERSNHEQKDAFQTPVKPAGPLGVAQGQSVLRRIRVLPRKNGYRISSESTQTITPPQQITQIVGGVNILIEESSADSGLNLGAVDLSADRIVIFTADFAADTIQRSEAMYQIYLEGNVVIRRKDHARQLATKITAARAYYDASANRAMYFDAEFESSASQVDGKTRLRAEQIYHNWLKNFLSMQGGVSSTESGTTGYRVRASDLFVENRDTSTLGADDSPTTVLLYFSATWCGPCQQMNPLIEEMRKKGYPIRTIDVDKETELTKKLQIESIPCFVMMKNSKELKRITGSTTEPQLRALLRAVESRDPAQE